MDSKFCENADNSTSKYNVKLAENSLDDFRVV